MDITSFLFYAFAGLLTASALLVVTRSNPVHAVLFLIFAFFNAAGLFVLLGAEYLAMTLVIVYVGAVAILFLFVVMMLNVQHSSMRRGMVKHAPLALLLAVTLLALLTMLMDASTPATVADAANGVVLPDPEKMPNAHAIGMVLYTDFIYAFQIAGLVLLVAMMGAIVLTHRRRPGVRKQNIANQVHRKREDCVTLTSPNVGEGV